MSGRGGLNRAYEDSTPIRQGSMMELAQLEGQLHTHIKKEVETALQREGCKAVVNVMNDQSRSRVSCELLKKNRAGEEKFLESGWCDTELEAEQKVFREAAKFYNLVDDQDVLKTRTWCTGVLNTLLSKYFKEKPPLVAALQNDPQNPNVGYFCEFFHESLANDYGEEDFPRVRGNTFKRKKDASHDAALQALKTWKYTNALASSHTEESSSDQSSSDSEGTSSSSEF